MKTTPVSKEEMESRKKAMYDAMSKRQQKYINKIGYEKWDPFEGPKDPVDIRRDATRRTSAQLFREFLYTRGLNTYSNAYGAGVMDICLGLMNDDDRYKGMFEFSCWYYDLLKKESGEDGG
ncbi:MAG: hypothetical protein CSB33_01420 [Desulfobacterales bacterium]|nr:MAG: hypothetical protein CSB33_01420 [Desulfobacterales bacterium]